LEVVRFILGAHVPLDEYQAEAHGIPSVELLTLQFTPAVEEETDRCMSRLREVADHLAKTGNRRLVILPDLPAEDCTMSEPITIVWQ